MCSEAVTARVLDGVVVCAVALVAVAVCDQELYPASGCLPVLKPTLTAAVRSVHD
jgi:hypothetical protein